MPNRAREGDPTVAVNAVAQRCWRTAWHHVVAILDDEFTATSHEIVARLARRRREILDNDVTIADHVYVPAAELGDLVAECHANLGVAFELAALAAWQANQNIAVVDDRIAQIEPDLRPWTTFVQEAVGVEAGWFTWRHDASLASLALHVDEAGRVERTVPDARVLHAAHLRPVG